MKIVQRGAGLTDEEMSEALGISREHYNRIKNGKHTLSSKMAMTLIDKFPNFFSGQNITEILLNSTQVLVPDGSQTPQNANLGVLVKRLMKSIKSLF